MSTAAPRYRCTWPTCQAELAEAELSTYGPLGDPACPHCQGKVERLPEPEPEPARQHSLADLAGAPIFEYERPRILDIRITGGHYNKARLAHQIDLLGDLAEQCHQAELADVPIVPSAAIPPGELLIVPSAPGPDDDPARYVRRRQRWSIDPIAFMLDIDALNAAIDQSIPPLLIGHAELEPGEQPAAVFTLPSGQPAYIRRPNLRLRPSTHQRAIMAEVAERDTPLLAELAELADRSMQDHELIEALAAYMRVVIQATMLADLVAPIGGLPYLARAINRSRERLQQRLAVLQRQAADGLS